MYNVVIVDDEYMIRQSLRAIIHNSDCGFHVAGEAKNGLEALNAVEEFSPHLLIVDIKMPVMDGLELLEKLFAPNREIEVIVVSGYDDFPFVQRAMRCGAMDYILKPIVQDLVVAAVKHAYERIAEKDTQRMNDIKWSRVLTDTGKAMADLIWALDEQAVLAAIGDLQSMLHEERMSPFMIKKKYLNLLSVIAGEIGHKGINCSDDTMIRLNGIGNREELIVAMFKQCILELVSTIRSSRNFGYRRSILNAARYIEMNYRNTELTLAEIAEFANMSVPRLSQLFKQEMGMGYLQYLTRTRMEQAMKCLARANSKAADVALEVGYADYPHFNKAFRKYCGCSPTEYKKRLGSY